MTEMVSRNLIQRCKNGDVSSFEKLFLERIPVRSITILPPLSTAHSAYDYVLGERLIFGHSKCEAVVPLL